MAAALALASQVSAADVQPDANTGYVTLALHDDWQGRPSEAQAVAALDGLRPCLVVNAYCQSSRQYGQRLRPWYPTLPAVSAQEPNGKLVYAAAGENVPKTAAAWKDIKGKLCDRLCPDGKCGPPKPQPGPQQVHIDPVDVNVNLPQNLPLPEPPKPSPPKPEPQFPWPLAIVVVILAGVVSLIVAFRREAAAV
jgi:hypothetical protein